MKNKLFCRVLFCFTLFFAACAATAAVVRLPGDTNGDGDVDISDILAIYGAYTGPDGSGMTADDGDTDGDGDVDITDLLAAYGAYTGPATPRTATPNIVVIYTDDMGYGDVGAFGANDIPTPNLDRMAAEGTMLTHCYNSSSACSTSRAALLTGCYHPRVSVLTVYGPGSLNGLHPDEITIAELVQDAGYATGMVGKWHLGHPEELMPYSQGFDWFYGIPVSHDYRTVPGYNGMPIYQKVPGAEVQVITTVHADDTGPDGGVQLYTERFTQKAVEFIDDHANSPFLLYVAYCLPHVTLAVTDEFDGVSNRGLYGDVMAELDAGIGRILEALEENGLDGNTIVVFASDNGPWLSFGDHAGSSGPLREGKRTVFDGGVRTPCIVYWPGQVPVQVVDTPCAIMDFYATFAGLTGTQVPTDRTVDSVDLAPLLLRDTDAADYDAERPIALYAYYNRSLHAVRMGKWKLVFPHSYQTLNQPGQGGANGSYQNVTTELALFDMENDSGETTNLAAANPAVVQQLTAAADVFRADLGDNATNTPPSDQVRPLGQAPGI